MNSLVERMKMDLVLQNYSPNTIKSYLWHINNFEQEVKKLLHEVDNLKYKCVMMLGYSAGLRISEALHLKVSDIDSERMQIRVDQGKGKKDRYTLLSKTMLIQLREYYKAYRPTQWLFPYWTFDRPLGSSSIQKAFKIAKKKPAYSNPLLFTH